MADRGHRIRGHVRLVRIPPGPGRENERGGCYSITVDHEQDEPDEAILQDILDDLSDVRGITDRKAAQLADTYKNLTTLHWATWHDRDYLQEEVRIRPGFLRNELIDAGFYRNIHDREEYIEWPDHYTPPYDSWGVNHRQARLPDYEEDE